MSVFLNVVLVVVLALSIVLFVAMRKVAADAAASVPAGSVSVADKQILGAHRLWSNLSIGLIALVIAGFVLINM